MRSSKHRVGFVGAGHISPYHAAALSRIPGVKLVGVYDLDPQRSERLAQQLGTRAVTSMDAFGAEGVDVIHVLTPPESHAQVALAALRLGAHVLVEKPLATDPVDCRRIADEARERGLRVCVDHSLLYDLQIRRAIETVRSGGIGRVVSVDILRSADYPAYEGGPLPVQYRSGGYPFRDLGIHQLYLLAALLGPIEDVRSDWYSLGGDPNLAFDEWRIEVRCRDGRAHVQISFNVRPIQNTIIIQGTKGVLRIEQMSMFSARRTAMPLPKAAERVLNAYGESFQSVAQVSAGVVGFVRKTLRQYDGVQRLIAEFYRTLDEGLPVPVSVEEATPIVEWVERIARAADADAKLRAQLDAQPRSEVPILVTGAAGGLGSAIVERLRSRQQRLRVFVRARGAREIPEGVEIASGDLGNPAAVDAAIAGARVVVHAGAATKGGWVEQHTSTVVGTQNVIDACLKHGVEQLVYISSLSVVDWAGGRSGEPITEESPLEPKPQLRGAYTQAKLEAEMLVRRAVRERGLRAVILRPGQIFGGKLPLVNAAVAREMFGRRVILGDGTIRLPLVYIDDVVDAVCAATDRGLHGGEIVQLVDDSLPTQNEILETVAGSSGKTLRVPRPAVFTLGWLSEIALRPLHRASPVSRYRLRSALARRTYVSRHAQQLLNWEPRIGVYAGIAAELERARPARVDRPSYAAANT
jgi:predicted dehydrogenase/nucleoside-diphosphate-sugar epimerase